MAYPRKYSDKVYKLNKEKNKKLERLVQKV